MSDAPVPVPFVSVIVPTYRDWNRLRRCLRALERQSYPADRFEILVVDNDAESPSTLDSAATNLIVLREPTPGSYSARNRAIAHARGELLAFTDSDCVPEPEWLERAVEVLRDRPDVARLAGRVVLFVEGPETPSSWYERIFAFQQERSAAAGTSVTANMFARRHVLDDIGPFDATMESGEDILWGLRAQARGHPVLYAPDVVVRHPARTELAELIRKSRRVRRGIYRIGRWHERPVIVRLAAGLLLLRPPILDSVKILRHKGLSLREKLSVASVLARLRLAQFSEHVRISVRNTRPEPVDGRTFKSDVSTSIG